MPALILPHDPQWADAFAREAAKVENLFGSESIELHHIGSTAIPGILAKPVIDMLGVVGALTTVDAAGPALAADGWRGKGENGIAGRRYFQKFGPAGEHSHHLHIFAVGSDPIARHLAFRDYLRALPRKAEEYSRLKAAIAAEPGMIRALYQQRKGPFVTRIEREAVAWADERQR